MCLKLYGITGQGIWWGELPLIALSANFRAFLLGYRCRISATSVLLVSQCSVCEQDVPTDWSKHVAAKGLSIVFAFTVFCIVRTVFSIVSFMYIYSYLFCLY